MHGASDLVFLFEVVLEFGPESGPCWPIDFSGGAGDLVEELFLPL